MNFKLIIIVNIIIATYATSIENLQVKPLVNPVTKCVHDFYTNISDKNYIIVYFSTTHQHVDNFIRMIDTNWEVMNIILMNGNEDKFVSVPQKFTTHFMFVSSVEEYEKVLRGMYGTAIWNADGRYLVGFYGDKMLDIVKFFTLSWKYYAINVNLIYEEVVYTYFPYVNGSCGENLNIEIIGRCDGFKGDIFPKKIPYDLMGCPIRAMVNIYPPYAINHLIYNESANLAGLDLTILNTFVRRYNLTRTTTYGAGAFAHKLPNGSYSGSLYYLYENISDLALGSLFPNIAFFTDLDVSLLYYYVHFSWVVPAARPGAQWKSLIFIFNKYLWLTIFAVILCNIAIWWIFSRPTIDNKTFKELSVCMLKCWYVFLQGGINLPHSFTMRILVIFWALFALLLATLYQSQLLSILLTPVFEHQVANTRELVDSKINIYFKQDFFMRFNNSGRPIDREIVQKGHVLSTVDHASVASKYHPNSAFLGNRAATLYLMPRNYSFPSGRPAMYMFDENEFGNPIAMFFRKGYPLLKPFNKMLSGIISNGLFVKWFKDATFFTTKIEESELQKVTLNHLVGAFFVLIFGLTTAILLFITEIVTFKCHHKIQK